MVTSSRDRLLAAAAREFAARGYDGASVDRIARAARLNKAMIYYHFKSKAGLYRAIVRDVFEAVLAALNAEHDLTAEPEARIARFVWVIAGVAATRPHFPPIWLAEFAGGLRHVDEATLRVAIQVVGFLRSILADGERTGRFRPIPSILVHVGIVAPLMFFAVSLAARERLARAGAPGARDLTADAMVRHVIDSSLGVLRFKEGESHA
jgi:TetR/AcrR family transcriptional regulator